MAVPFRLRLPRPSPIRYGLPATLFLQMRWREKRARRAPRVVRRALRRALCRAFRARIGGEVGWSPQAHHNVAAREKKAMTGEKNGGGPEKVPSFRSVKTGFL